MGYAEKETEKAAQSMGIEFEAVPRSGKGVQVTRKCWGVERTLALLGKFRKLSKNYEQCVFFEQILDISCDTADFTPEVICMIKLTTPSKVREILWI